MAPDTSLSMRSSPVVGAAGSGADGGAAGSTFFFGRGVASREASIVVGVSTGRRRGLWGCWLDAGDRLGGLAATQPHAEQPGRAEDRDGDNADDHPLHPRPRGG